VQQVRTGAASGGEMLQLDLSTRWQLFDSGRVFHILSTVWNIVPIPEKIKNMYKIKKDYLKST
jgi:hypothetical protein